jgi:hypothetical protein
MRLSACALVLWPLFACTQRATVATTPARVGIPSTPPAAVTTTRPRAGAESACSRLSRLARTSKPRLFALVEVTDPKDAAVWREFDTKEALVDLESYTVAEVWTSDDGWFVSMTLGSPSGDWMNSVDYCFRGDQSLASIRSSLGTVYAVPNPVTRSRETSFSPDGRQLSQVTTVTDQVTGQVLTTSSFQDKPEEVFMTVRDLPFALLLPLAALQTSQ